MKNIALSIAFLIALLTTNSSSKAQSMVKIRFYDSCKDSVLKLHYELDSGLIVMGDIYHEVKDSILVKKPGLYTLILSFPRGNFKGKFGNGHYQAVYYYVINIDGVKNYTDTIELPRVTFCSTGALHDSYYKSYNCDELSNGHVLDYYKNGTKRSEGDYINGWPVRVIKYYDKTGKLIAKEKYDKYKLKRFILYTKEKYVNL